MASKYLNRKYIAVAFCLMGLGAQIDILSRSHALYPLPWGRLLEGAASGLLLPGGFVSVLTLDVTGRPLPFTLLVYLSLAFWFFPMARVRRAFGQYDAFGGGKVGKARIVRGVADGLDALNKRLFGRQKTGGWS